MRQFSNEAPLAVCTRLQSTLYENDSNQNKQNLTNKEKQALTELIDSMALNNSSHRVKEQNYHNLSVISCKKRDLHLSQLVRRPNSFTSKQYSFFERMGYISDYS